MSFELLGYTVGSWQLLTTLGLILMLMEIFSPGFVLFPIGLAFIMTVPFTFFLDHWLTQLSVLGINLLIIFWIFSKFVRPKLKKEAYKTNVDAMVGNLAEVVEPFEGDQLGYVKLYGDRWQCYSTSGESYTQGEKVKITRIDGNKVVVSKLKH